MKNIIEELFYGNIDPQTRVFKKGSYIQNQMTILANSESLLNETLTGEEQKAFTSFVDASSVSLGKSELDSFMVGFRLGARFVY
ncbi:MAG: hypothetical protein U0L36_05300, partial [Acutalibacteraceae bacterium]|nr:hypothetical protein [Acutalibacteraceae bacterium]